MTQLAVEATSAALDLKLRYQKIEPVAKLNPFFWSRKQEGAGATAEPQLKTATLRAVRVGAVVLGSAFCGGIAAVLWNRTVLKRLREAAAAPMPDQAADWSDEEEADVVSGHRL